MEKAQYPEDYIGKKKVADIDWRKFKDSDDDLDDVDDKPASKEVIESLGVDPDELFKSF
jgi:predicted transcriptional regulator